MTKKKVITPARAIECLNEIAFSCSLTEEQRQAIELAKMVIKQRRVK